MSLQTKTAIKDVAPGILDPLPPQVVSYCDRLYGQSLQKPLNKLSEIARYHICAYLTVEKYRDQFNLPEPDQTRIPLAPRMALNTINAFRAYMEGIKTATSTPTRKRTSTLGSPTSGSPTKRTRNLSVSSNSSFKSAQSSPDDFHTPAHQTPRKLLRASTDSPTKSKSSPTKSSPLKKLQALADDSDSDNENFNESSPFVTPKSGPLNVIIHSISIRQLIQLCNRFYIPPPVTENIIQSFIDQRHKFVKKGTWYLALALVYVASIRINHRIATERPNYNDILIAQLARSEPGLRKHNIAYWCGIVNDDVKYDPWILELEAIYKHGIRHNLQHDRELEFKLGKGYKVYDKLGFMFNSHTDLTSYSQSEYYHTWSSSALLQLE